MTNTLKYSLGALGFIILLFLYNHNSQKSHTVAGEAIYTGQRENVARKVISENDKEHKSPDAYRTNDNVYFYLNSNVPYWGSKPPKPEPEDKKEEN